MGKHTVFVYGTLKRDLHNHHLLKRGSKFLGVGYTIPRFAMLGGGFPVLVWPSGAGPRQRHVYGELYEVDDETMADLDRLEAVGQMYDRKELPVMMIGEGNTSREAKDAHIYVGRDDCWLGESGEYRWPFYSELNEYGDLDWRPTK